LAAGLDEPQCSLASTLVVACAIVLLAEPDFEEHQEQAAGEARGHQAYREDFSDDPLDQCGTCRPCDDQRAG
jgi:hypothetical protein